MEKFSTVFIVKPMGYFRVFACLLCICLSGAIAFSADMISNSSDNGVKVAANVQNLANDASSVNDSNSPNTLNADQSGSNANGASDSSPNNGTSHQRGAARAASRAASANGEPPVYHNNIAAIVNNEIITMGQLMREVAFFIPRIRENSKSQVNFMNQVEECSKFVLNSLIERILIVDDFKSRGGKIPDNYERKEYEAFIRSRFDGDRVTFAKYLRESGQSVREFKKNIREQAIVGFSLHSLQDSKPEISAAKIKEYYDGHIGEYSKDRTIFLHEIALLNSKHSGAQMQKKLDELKIAISNGEDIQSLVKKFSDAPRSATVGWVCVDDLIPEFANVIRLMGSGEFSEPVALSDRICVLLISGERPAKRFAIEEVSGEIERKLTAKYQTELKDNYIKKLRDKAYIKIFSH
jgi:peptidyl-prolyl cis-trans isomerase SurA